jgi:spore coat protein U-like protein
MSLQRLCLLVLLGLAWGVFAPNVLAAESCNVTATGVNFGVYEPSSATPVNGQGSMTVSCTGNQLPVKVTLTAGGSGSYATRQMNNGTNLLYYNLYLNAARNIIFGDGSGGSQSVTCTTGAATSGIACTGSNPGGADRIFVLPIYGTINASQNAALGVYNDTIFYTLTF